MMLDNAEFIRRHIHLALFGVQDAVANHYGYQSHSSLHHQHTFSSLQTQHSSPENQKVSLFHVIAYSHTIYPVKADIYTSSSHLEKPVLNNNSQF